MEKGFRQRILVRVSGKAMSAREEGKRQICAEKAMEESITELQPNTRMSRCASVFYGCKLLIPVLFSTFLYSFYLLFKADFLYYYYYNVI